VTCLEPVTRGEGASLSMPALSARGVGVLYDGVPAVLDVSLDMRAGGITAIVGPSGCGKSSFLFALNRLNETVPGCTLRGEIHLFGKLLTTATASLTELRRRVAMIFQTPTPFPLSIRRNLEIPLIEHFGRNRSEIADRMESALRAVGLWDEVSDRLDSPATSLSGGQQQRLCLARALVLEPEILLLDEPCSALDPLATQVIEELLLSLRGQLSLVLVTHNMAQARRLADDAALFWVRGDCGYVVECGPAERLFNTPESDVGRAYFAGRMG